MYNSPREENAIPRISENSTSTAKGALEVSKDAVEDEEEVDVVIEVEWV